MTLIKISRDELLKPLQAVSGIIERRHTLPILSNVLLIKQAKQISMVATDIEIEITAYAQTESPGEEKAITVGARKLLDILRALPEGSEVSLSLQEKRLQLKSAKSRFNLQTLPAEDFPRLSVPEDESSKLSVPQKLLKSMINIVQYAMAQQDIRYYLNGMLMVLDGASLTLVATDGHRLGYISRELAGGSSSRREVILPRKTIIELSKLLADNDEPVSMEISPTQARFAFGGIFLISKLVDGKFPDYTRVIPQEQPKHLRLKRQELLSCLQRAAILTSDKFRGVRWVLSNGSLKIICTNTEQEEAQEELDVDYKGDALDVGFNVGYLLDVLNNLGVDEIDCGLGDANSSALITVPGKNDFKYVVMPMRI
ncbi:MAG: DNA polymerase III subunit beta [Betaproteobacteria bacterium RIFCSPLOWO2_02_FULL_62_17]|nr:MAG: DNA polymerase III subunit beta [Betaproteobacteria bacterium RIFCSPLOWO2_02_FULL_62_17]